MGLVEELKGLKVCIDTAPFIYFIEKQRKYLDILKLIFTKINDGDINGLTSTITLLEVLVHPLKSGNESLAEKYREVLLYSENLITFGVTNEVSEKAANLRAKYLLKTPDAIQIATGILYGAEKFLTNDPVLRKVTEIQVLVLDDFVI